MSRAIFAGAAAWVALEYLRTYLFSGFPWTLLADSQVKVLPLIQIASITGIYGVSFLIILVNLTVLELLLARNDSLPLQRQSHFLLLGCILFGVRHMRALDRTSSDRTIQVALLQGNIDQYKKWDKAYVEEIQKTYERLVRGGAKTKPDIIIWPETSVPGYLFQDLPCALGSQISIHESRTAQLVGAPALE